MHTVCSNQEGRDFTSKCQRHKHVQPAEYFLSKPPRVTFTELVLKGAAAATWTLRTSLKTPDVAMGRWGSLCSQRPAWHLRSSPITISRRVAPGKEAGAVEESSAHPPSRTSSTEFTSTLQTQTPNRRIRWVISLAAHLNSVGLATFRIARKIIRW